MLGAIQTDKFIVQNLASLYIGEATTYEDTRVHYLAKVFTSLPRARDTLNQYYERISDQVTITPIAPEDPQGPRVRCFSPYSTELEEYQARPGTEPQPTEFEYINVPDAHPANVTFFAQVKSSNRKFVTKFVGRYGMEAHELLASERHEQMEEVIKKLHNAGFVFGDLPLPNILFSKGKASLIDFDWACRSGEARYPRGLSRNAGWPADPASLKMKLIKPYHDIFMLDRLSFE